MPVSQVDHIGIGRCGVIVIDSKNVAGRVKVDWKGGLFSERRWYLYVDGRNRTDWVEGVERQVAAAASALADAGYPAVPVAGVLCMANGGGLPWLGHAQLRNVAISRPRQVARRLRADGPLSEADIDQIARILERAFPPVAAFGHAG